MNHQAVAQIVKQFVDGYKSQPDSSIKESNLLYLKVAVALKDPQIFINDHGEKWAKEAQAAAEYIVEHESELLS